MQFTWRQVVFQFALFSLSRGIFHIPDMTPVSVRLLLDRPSSVLALHHHTYLGSMIPCCSTTPKLNTDRQNESKVK